MKSLTLSTQCNNTNDNSATAFQKALGTVKDSSDDPREKGDPFPEALFYGIEQALEDMEGCPEHLKLLFVIGDHGDNTAHPSSSLLQSLNETFNLFAIFFIQTAGAGHEAGFISKDSCFNASPIANFQKGVPAHAYQRFQRQACQIFDALAKKRGGARDEYYNLHSL